MWYIDVTAYHKDAVYWYWQQFDGERNRKQNFAPPVFQHPAARAAASAVAAGRWQLHNRDRVLEAAFVHPFVSQILFFLSIFFGKKTDRCLPFWQARQRAKVVSSGKDLDREPNTRSGHVGVPVRALSTLWLLKGTFWRKSEGEKSWKKNLRRKKNFCVYFERTKLDPYRSSNWTLMAKKEPPYGYPLDATLNRGRAPHHHHQGLVNKVDPHPGVNVHETFFFVTGVPV
jgi:hypothetical protein